MGFNQKEFESFKASGSVAAPESQGLNQQEYDQFAKQMQQPEWRVHPFIEGTKKAALPMIGAGIGQMAAPVFPVAGAMGGAGIGEYLNQKLGITEESPGQMLWAAGSQAILPALGAGYRVAKGMAPKAGAEALHRIAPQELAKRVKGLAPAVPSRQLFEQATQGGGTVPLTKTLSEIDDVLLTVGRGSKGLQEQYGMTRNFLTKLKAHIARYGGQLPPNLLQDELSGLGRIVGKLDRAGDKVNAPHLKRIFGALSDELDDAAKVGSSVNWAPEAAKALQLARQAFKRESVMKEILQAGDEASFIKAGVGDTIQFRANKLLNALPSNKFFQQSLSTAEKNSVLGLLKTLNSLPAIPPGAGSSWGSGRLWQSLAAFGGAGAAVGNVPGGGVGLAVGAVAPIVKDIATNISLATKTELGRQLLKDLLKSQMRPINKLLLSQAMAYAASQSSQERQANVQMQESGIPEPQPLVPELNQTAMRP